MKKYLIVLFSISFVFVLLLFPYKVVVSTYSFTPEQQKTVDYLKGKSQLDQGYTALERLHLEDVKNVMFYADLIFYISLLISTFMITYHRKKVQKFLFYGGVSTIVTTIFILLFSFVSFEFLFALFHEILFPQGNWLFPADSLLIRTFPLDLFVSISIRIFVLAFILGSIFIGQYYYGKYVNHRKRH